MNNIIRKKTTLIRALVYLIIFIALMPLYNYFINYNMTLNKLSFHIVNDVVTEYQIFYVFGENEKKYTEINSQKFISDVVNSSTEIDMSLYGDDLNYLRIDFGYIENVNFLLKEISVKNLFKTSEYDAQSIGEFFNGEIKLNQLQIIEITDEGVKLLSTGTDPYIEFHVDNHAFNSYIIILLSIVLSLLTTLIIYKFVNLRVIYNLFLELFINRKLILSLSYNDFKTKYAGSYFGIIWAFVQPVCTILIFWFVFQVGFRSEPIQDAPFILWLTCGLIPWFFFADAWGSATNSFIDYSYLVKKVVFKINILPIVKVISSLMVHFVFIAFIFVMFSLYKIYPNVYMLQIFYYMLCMIALVIGLSLITSSLIIFFKDLGQIMNIVLQFGMWVTPIMWHTNMIPSKFVWIFKLNPMYYIIQGYRDSMLTDILFYQNVRQTLYFWSVTLIIIFIGSVLFTKLKPHFSDVL